jgi:predicted  nucleic acid-binding Zn-ribbon protein
MSKEPLRQTLEQLHDELEQTKKLDDASRAMLRDLMEDIQKLLEASDEEAAERHDSLMGRLSDAMKHFEDDHPTLVAVLGRISDSLGRLAV